MRLPESEVTATAVPAARAASEKQIRLALVCYGGVSLAIYMHGITKEIHKLVVASRAFEDDQTTNPFRRDQTEHAYWEALGALEKLDGLRRRIVVDVISGTSAGGINGVFLGKALALNRSQESLKQVWLDRGDIAKLLGAPMIPAAIKLPAWLLFRVAIPRALSIASFAAPPLRRKLRARRRSPLLTRPPLKGHLIARWLHEALTTMNDAEPDGPESMSTSSLMPDGHSLELFVTATDYHGLNQEIWIADPSHVSDLRHRHVLTFSHLNGALEEFDASHDAELTFAAASTSAFPGAFPPVTIPDVRRALGNRWPDTAAFERRCFRLYQLAGVPPQDAFLVDGGALDNFPFGHAIRAVVAKPAASQVSRRLLYIEPDPAMRAAITRIEPSLLPTFVRSALLIPRQESILDDLATVRAFNDRVRGANELIGSSMTAVERGVDALGPGIETITHVDELETWTQRVHEKLPALAGPGYGGYVQLKMVSVVRQLAETVCRIADLPPASDQGFFVHEVFHRWALLEGILATDGSRDDGTLSKEQLSFLRSFDLSYGERRLRFIIQMINEMYPQVPPAGEAPWGAHPDRNDLNETKRALYTRIGALARAATGSAVPADVRSTILRLFDPQALSDFVAGNKHPDVFAAEQRVALTEIGAALGRANDESLHEAGWSLYRAIDRLTTDWAPGARRAMLRRLVAFPLWDAIMFPLRAVGDVGELQTIDVVRVSPGEATLLGAGSAKDKLKGVKIAHFGAFFRRAWRENDYLWGRLDGAERMIALLFADASRASDPASARLAADAFAAVLASERSLRRVRRVRRSLQRRVDALRNAGGPDREAGTN